MIAKWGRNTDDDGVAAGELREVNCRRGSCLLDKRSADATSTDVTDIRLARAQRLGLLRIDIKTDDLETGLSKEKNEWQADISESDHTDAGGA